MTILITIIALGFVIFIHELGHFIAAKKAKVGVSEFAVGMGPKIFSFDYQETMVSLRALPIGGFVRVKGLEDTENCSIEEDYRQKSAISKASILAAGSFMNFVLGLVIFTMIGFFSGDKEITNTIETIVDNYPAQEVGLKSGDKIIAINNKKLRDVQSDLMSFISQSNGEPFYLTVLQDNQEKVVTISAQLNEREAYVIGVGFKVDSVPLNIIESFVFGFQKTGLVIGQTIVGLKMLISGEATINDMAGPVGIIQLASAQFKTGLFAFLGLIAFISINLGVINLFPIPVLDGGHLLLLLIEVLRGKPLDKKAELVINNTAAAFLIGLMIFIVFNDLINWNERMSIIKDINK